MPSRYGRAGVQPFAFQFGVTSIDTLMRIRRLLGKSPVYVAGRAWHELTAQAERMLAPRRARRTQAAHLAKTAGHGSVGSWWDSLFGRPGPAPGVIDREALDRRFPGERERILALAERAMAHRVDLLGSGETALGPRIDWHRDFKSGERWAPAFCKSIAYNNLDRPSDVKVPWELSRMQWLIPLGQAYALTKDERYAVKLRELIDDWITENPHAWSVNWACTMDVALRAICWIWFFQTVGCSKAWSDDGFRSRFLKHLFLHGDFVSRHLEKGDVNGNHYTADAAGLAMIGQFMADLPRGRSWRDKGWQILLREIETQVFPDGVDFEASVPYHRLVQELLLWPALYRRREGLPVPVPYRDRLAAMARFTEAYSRPDGSAPLWGDADDARVLPFGGQDINDHRYLVGLAGVALDDADLVARSGGPSAEAAWALGLEAASSLVVSGDVVPRSVAFRDGGFFILRDARNHVFIDCGPLGLAGRGGHGHNDLLAFEAAIDGTTLISDCGAYLYTADFHERNAFRSTRYHNTPQVDGEEIYRFVAERDLWSLRNDADARVEAFDAGETCSRFSGTHDGYARLADPVIVHRSFSLFHGEARLLIEHRFECALSHHVSVPFHFAIGVRATLADTGRVTLEADGRTFTLQWEGESWRADIEPARVSPRYGVVIPTQRLVLTTSQPRNSLAVVLSR
jgi:uncharacterized heparinase superfamily protein